MITCIIFSKDRAMQLSATLESLILHCIDYEKMQIVILYKCSSEQHFNQYNKLIVEWTRIPQIKFYKQTSFRKDIFTILNSYPHKSLLNLSYSFFCRINPRLFRLLPFKIINNDQKSTVFFLVDDSVFTHQFSVVEISTLLLEQKKVIGFSLRLGKNTSYCYMSRRPQKIPIFIPLAEKILSFDWTEADADFGYPLEVSSSIYRLKDLIPLLFRSSFDNPNSLEVGLFENNVHFRKSHPILLCYTKSVAFCNPINMVQESIIENRAGELYLRSPKELSDLFEKGYRIDIEKINGLETNSCHQEVEFSFREISR